MAEQGISVDYEELHMSPRESIADGGIKGATRVLKCAWSDRLALAEQIAGGVDISGTFFGGQLYPHNNNLRAVTVGISPFGGKASAESGDGRVASYECAQLEVGYEIPPEQERSGGGGGGSIIFSETLEWTTEFLTLPTEGLFWSSDGEDEDPVPQSAAPGLRIDGLMWTYTRHRLTTPPAAIATLAGKVNAGGITALTLGLSFAAETLLFTRPTLTRTVTSAGVSTIDITYRFPYRESTWNKFPRPSMGAGFFPMYLGTGAQYKPYATGDFTQLTG